VEGRGEGVEACGCCAACMCGCVLRTGKGWVGGLVGVLARGHEGGLLVTILAAHLFVHCKHTDDDTQMTTCTHTHMHAELCRIM